MGSMSVLCLLGIFTLLHSCYGSVEVGSSSIDQPYRTGYHFQPPENWINDPNGPMLYKGIYHLFYQYNPHGAVWSPSIVWGHSTSTDLINWVHHDDAIERSIPSDINGCWSGSATILPGDIPAMLYTGRDTEERQVQNLAVPKNLSDPFLTEWIKAPENPVMPLPEGIQGDSFRDPSTAWQGPDGEWRVIVGGVMDRQGLAILYRSKDFTHWVKADSPLYSENESGMWECPDFFPVHKSVTCSEVDDTSLFGYSAEQLYVLKISLFDPLHDFYTIGTYNHEKDEYTPRYPEPSYDGKGDRFDYGKYYASKTFFDSANNRRILWAWVNESTTVDFSIKMGWAGLQGVPRTIALDKSERKLIQWPITELNSLRTGRVDLHETVVKGDSVLKVSGVTASQADVEVSFDLSELKEAEEMDPSWVDPQLLCSKMDASVQGKVGPFGLLVLASEKLEEQTAIFFRVFKKENSKYVVLMCSDQSRSSLEEEDLDKTTYGAFVDVDLLQEKLSLRTLIDHSIVENFAGLGKTCITARVYPTLAIGAEAQIYVFNNGTGNVKMSSLSAWSMKNAKMSSMRKQGTESEATE